MRQRGFTLLEVIVVILVIALLCAIVIPVLLRRARESARRTACAHNLSSIGKAMVMYSEEPANGGFFPARSTKDDPFADEKPMMALGFLFNQYVIDPRVFSCPSKPMAMGMRPSISRTHGTTPSDAAEDVGYGSSSYGYDPGHGPNDGVAALLADKKGAGENSDNHGQNAGQNVLLGNGTVQFIETPMIGSDNIFKLDAAIPRKQDAYIRQ